MTESFDQAEARRARKRERHAELQATDPEYRARKLRNAMRWQEDPMNAEQIQKTRAEYFANPESRKLMNDRRRREYLDPAKREKRLESQRRWAAKPEVIAHRKEYYRLRNLARKAAESAAKPL